MKGKGLILFASFLLLGLVSCGSSVTDPDGGDAPEESGRLTVLLTDAPFPFDMVSAANVTISRVDIVSETGVHTIAEGEQTFNLLDLQNGVTAVLAQANLAAGAYPQIRLIVTSASVTLTDGRTFDLFVPSGAQTGVKVLLPDFVVGVGTSPTLTLDFDVSRSFIMQGNANTPADIQGFIFVPVVKPLGFEADESDE